MKVVMFSAKARCGKDASALILKELMESDDKKVLIIHYGDLLKYICTTYFNWDGEKDEDGRELLQKIGTDVIREQKPDYWVNFVGEFLSMFKYKWDYVLIPDCRFPNEVIKMKEYGFDTLAVRVNRIDFESQLTEEQKNHISETALDSFSFDYYINSKSGIEYLRKEVMKLYESV